MGRPLSVSVFDGEVLKTYTLDDTLQSALPLFGQGGCVELGALSWEEPGLCLVPAEGVTLSVAGYETLPAGPVVVDEASTVLLGVGHHDLKSALSLYTHPLTPGMARFRKVTFAEDATFEVGRDAACEVVYDNMTVSSHHVRCTWEKGAWSVRDLGSANGTFVNGKRVAPLQPHRLVAGDVMQLADLVMAFCDAFLCVNAPEEITWRVEANADARLPAAPRTVGPSAGGGLGREPELPVFYPAPCLSTTLRPVCLSVDAPPAQNEGPGQPLIARMGPSFLMGLCALAMVAQTLARMRGKEPAWEALPSLAMAASMAAGSLLWPPVMHVFEKRAQRGLEALRTARYMAYLDRVEDELAHAAERQQQILSQRLFTVGELMARAEALSPELMSHGSGEEGFLCLRLGVGPRPLEAQVVWPERRFSLMDDVLWERVEELRRHMPCLAQAPIDHDFAKGGVTGIVGQRALVWELVRGLVVQVCANYSYQDVKLALVADVGERDEWESLLPLPHLYDDSRRSRRLALTRTGMARLDALVEESLSLPHQNEVDAQGSRPHLVVLCACPRIFGPSSTARLLPRASFAGGVSFVVLGAGIHDLPRECGYVIDLTECLATGGAEGDRSWAHGLGPDVVPGQGAASSPSLRGEGESRLGGARSFRRSDVAGTFRRFTPDIFVTAPRMRAFSLNVARVRLKGGPQSGGCPQELGIMGLFEVGNVERLDVPARWERHDASRTLGVRVGRNTQGMPVYLDLHERFQGPHALIAGTTGSGKSEFIITAVLALCANYAPDEVSFVLIDYKGGGLAGAFDNPLRRLPHLAGTVTNLDGEQVWRALASLRSELERRQRMLREACERLGEATMDIHRYLSLYRQGILEEPLPHLFVVADEFAELKQQEPDFMEGLITAARIGRSLGVHLILATQKPTGVVNDQIWSNARLKVCLKVADAADSKEMLRREDAAYLTRPGEFLLLVGYDEQYLAGQAAYAGGPYCPLDTFVERGALAAELLDDEGEVTVSLRPQADRQGDGRSEFAAVLDAIVAAAEARALSARRLWLEALPEVLAYAGLLAGHAEADVVLGASAESKVGVPARSALPCTIGLADDPYRQRQLRVDADLARAGSVALFGMQGSEVERLMRAMLASLVSRRGAKELWVYAVDYGDGLLGALRPFPQCGGFVSAADAGSLGILGHMLDEELVSRRADLARSKARAVSKPSIVLAIANVAAYLEADPSHEDWLATFVREGPRYGMYLLVSGDRVGALPYRIRSGIGVCLPTWLNDEAQYHEVLGNLGSMVVPQRPCRGVVGVEGRALVFQGCVWEDDPAAEEASLEALCLAMDSDGPHARPLPCLPKKVRPQDLDGPPGFGRFPVGLSKADVTAVFASCGPGSRLLVLGNDGRALDGYMRGACAAMAKTPTVIASEGQLSALLEDMGRADADPRVIVVPHVVQTLARLSPALRSSLEQLLVGKEDMPVAVVMTSEYWRVQASYDEWLRVATLGGEGLWLGDGFADQTLLRLPRVLPEYREPVGRFDGYFVSHGAVEAVRVVRAYEQRGEVFGDGGEGTGVSTASSHA